MKVRFKTNFDWKPEGDARSYHLAFRADRGVDGRGLYTVTRECGAAAIAAGVATAEEPQQDAPPATPAESE